MLVKPVLAQGAELLDYSGTGFKYADSTVGAIFGDVLSYVYVFAGLALLLMLISGGFGLMTSAGNPDKLKSGYGRITSALIGFLIVFVSYIVVKIMESVFGLTII
jgi:phosphate starvation-inducible membrane PsiE